MQWYYYSRKRNLNFLLIFSGEGETEDWDFNDDEIPILLPNLITYGVMKVVTIVTTPNIGKIEEVMAPTSWPALATTKDNSPLADAIPNPVLNAVMPPPPYRLALTNIALIIRNFDAKDVKTSNIAGTISKGIWDKSINAPIDIKNIAANISLKGIVITLATLALFDSATNTPAKNAPVATDRPNSLAANDKPNANPRITIRISA